VNGKQLPLDLKVQSDGRIHGWESIDGLHHKVQISDTYGLLDFFGKIVVPKNKYFGLDDRRNNSQDSHYWGFVDGDKIMDKVIHIAFSFSAKRPFLSRFAVKVYWCSYRDNILVITITRDNLIYSAIVN